MKSLIYSPYLDAMGGGERYILTIAEYLASHGTTHILWDDTSIVPTLAERFHLDLQYASTLPTTHLHKHWLSRMMQKREYDVLVYLSDGSFPFGFAKTNIMHLQMPFDLKDGRSLKNKLKLATWKTVVVNSRFTKEFVDKTFGIDAYVLYPPVDVAAFHPTQKQSAIISVGRFHGFEHGKKQEVLIETFKKLYGTGIRDWQLWLVGSVENRQYYDELRKRAAGYPISFYGDASFETLVDLYGKAAVYWHALGFLETEPKYKEHFGMTTVEAMAAGCVPVVTAGGGQEEIVDDGVNGFLWHSIDELVEKTCKIIADRHMRDQVTHQAIATSRKFSKQKFMQEIAKLVI